MCAKFRFWPCSTQPSSNRRANKIDELEQKPTKTFGDLETIHMNGEKLFLTDRKIITSLISFQTDRVFVARGASLFWLMSTALIRKDAETIGQINWRLVIYSGSDHRGGSSRVATRAERRHRFRKLSHRFFNKISLISFARYQKGYRTHGRNI